VPNQRRDRIGLLVVRAIVEENPRRRLLVRLLEVNLPGPDRLVGVADSSETAARLFGSWLDSLHADLPADSATDALQASMSEGRS
jgi:hypothetical protein